MNDLDIEGLVGSVLRGALGGGRKRKRGAFSYLAGGQSSFLNASTLLTVAGVAWGLWESAQASSATPLTTPAPGAPPAQGLAVPPTIPGSATAGTGVPLTTPPPLPGTAPASGAPAAVPPDVLRVLRLTLAAARADGHCSSLASATPS